MALRLYIIDSMDQRRSEGNVMLQKPATLAIFLITLTFSIVYFTWDRQAETADAEMAALVLLGAKAGPLVMHSGQWWRLVTAGFLNGGSFLNALINLCILVDLGWAVEDVYKANRLVILFFASTIFGFLVSCLWSPGVSEGSGPPALGMIAALAISNIKDSGTDNALHHKMTRFYWYAILAFISGLLPSARSDFPALIGGALMGIAIALVAGAPASPDVRRGRERALDWIARGCIVISGISFILLYTWSTTAQKETRSDLPPDSSDQVLKLLKAGKRDDALIYVLRELSTSHSEASRRQAEELIGWDYKQLMATYRLEGEHVWWSPDDTVIISNKVIGVGDQGWTLKGSPPGTPKLTAAPILAASFSPNSNILVTTDARTVRVLHVGNWEQILPDVPHGSEVLDVRFSPDGKTIATGGADGSLRFLRASNLEPVGAPLHHDSGVLQMRYSPDGKRLAARLLSTDDTIWLWRLDSQPALITRIRHLGFVVAFDFTPDSSALVTAGADGKVQFWSSDGRLPRAPLHQPAGLGSFAISPDGRYFLTGCVDGLARLWDTGTNALVAVFPHGGAVTAVAFSSDSRLIAVGGEDKVVQLWVRESRESLGGPLRHAGPIHWMRFSRDSTKLLTESDDTTGQYTGHVGRLWRVPPDFPTTIKTIRQNVIRSAAISADGAKLVVCGWDRTCQLWDARSREKLGHASIELAEIAVVGFSVDSRQYFIGGEDGGLSVFDAASGAALGRLRMGAAITALAFSSDGRTLAVGSADNSIRLWAIHEQPGNAEQLAPENLTFVKELVGHSRPIIALGFGPDGFIFSGSADRRCLRWDLGANSIVGEWRHEDPRAHSSRPEHAAISALAVSPNGQVIATGSDDRTVRAWRSDQSAPFGSMGIGGRVECDDTIQTVCFLDNQAVFSATSWWLYVSDITGSTKSVRLLDGRWLGAYRFSTSARDRLEAVLLTSPDSVSIVDLALSASPQANTSSIHDDAAELALDIWEEKLAVREK
jgi:WD40 repeat protein/membrane associated rhomboid family serine protease